ncbi:GNAT family N-acetyltransferase [Gammaproteobacteria bacterium]|nr:GNAT family N-acetyltransferase [Gammaproteobacteria bacterium]
MMKTTSERLNFVRFAADDVSALAELLADPSLTRNITANGSTPERCLACAHKRIAWHNSSWGDEGYGVWALYARDESLAAAGRLLGWCGFIPPDGDDPDAEILYAVDAEFRGLGLASEAAQHAIEWLFTSSDHQGVTAVISTRLNPGSVNVVSKLGLSYRGKMGFELFLSSAELADEVADYEIWRLAQDSITDPEVLLEQVAFRAGQLSGETSFSTEQILQRLLESLAQRYPGASGDEQQQQRRRLDAEYAAGQVDAYMDCYHITRKRWAELTQS